MAFKEPKPMSKEPKPDSNLLTITSGQQDKKAPSKRPPISDLRRTLSQKRKKVAQRLYLKVF